MEKGRTRKETISCGCGILRHKLRWGLGAKKLYYVSMNKVAEVQRNLVVAEAKNTTSNYIFSLDDVSE